MYNGRHMERTNNKVATQLIVMGKYNTTLGNRKISYLLKRSTTAKLIWLNIKRQTGLTVTIPQNYKVRYLQEYLELNTEWILRNLDKYCSEPAEPSAKDVRPAHTISYLGKNMKVMQKHNGSRLTNVKLQQNKIIISLGLAKQNLSCSELEHWLKAQATKLIKEKVKYFSGLMSLEYNRVVIRDQKSRWGSCSCRKNLNFNWRLIMAPEPVLDYVIIHELCHLKDMSHSKSFWSIVEEYCPKWHEYRDWLDNHYIELNAQLQF